MNHVLALRDVPGFSDDLFFKYIVVIREKIILILFRD